MAEQEQPQNNVVTINGKEYNATDMEPNQQYLIAQLRDLQTKADNLRFQLDQVTAGQKMFTDELIKSVEEVDEAPAAEEAAAG